MPIGLVYEVSTAAAPNSMMQDITSCTVQLPSICYRALHHSSADAKQVPSIIGVIHYVRPVTKQLPSIIGVIHYIRPVTKQLPSIIREIYYVRPVI